MPRSARALLPLVLVVLTLATGCGRGMTCSLDTGFQCGDGAITLLPPAKRKQPDAVTGTTLTGTTVALSQFQGKVVVINVWGSWCGPCRSEADDLALAAKELLPQGVVFLGINTRDNSRDTALAFVRKHAMPYDSIFDPGGRTLGSFHRTLSPNAIPSTVVIDAQGRVAASIIGEVTSARTLIDLVDEVQK
ncbi:TlpA disulfide reductase family protein [Nocardioides marmorisolisilvae]|uniref:TlpA family protein disulfide reductase n=1 Tax=Nocardioides marmorisolisilvae TaxID=1542737 RepID=A0A3N0DZZ8_9ACTN|nr:TlpA disulfide reductase family protein [Nocardioides marmorisolisilvae]RNL81189.1 TlpA family protein disulfide reductase [Nocardioides marmorisolisilvae]